MTPLYEGLKMTYK